MKIPVSIKIYSLIKSTDGDSEPYVGVTECHGELDCSPGESVLTYTEQNEGDKTTTRLTVTEDCVRLKNRGSTVCDLYFRRGAVYDTVYTACGFSFDAHVESEPPSVTLSERGGELRLGYTMNLGGDPRLAKLKITVTPDA